MVGLRPSSACALAAWALALAACGEAPARPDVLLVTVDTLRADHLGAYGHPVDTSPHVDALAASGVLFERAVAASGRTAPSHASIFTSRYVRGHSIGFRNGDSALVGGTTLAEAFRAAGYDTAAFVGNLLLAGRLGFARGFDVYDDELTAPERNRPHVVERRADPTTDRALAWLERPRDRPFFLWVHYQDPHGPYTPPAPFDRGFEGEIPERDPELRVGGLGTRHRIPAYQVLGELRRASAYRARYRGEIAYADRAIGRLLGAVDPARTVVLLTADHGESLGEGGQWFKHTHTTTPDVAHVPLILRAPGLAPGRRREIVHHVDVLPTLLELAGLPVPEGARGLALGPLLRAGAPLPERTVYCDHGPELSAYSDGGFLQLEGAGGAWGPARSARGLRAERFDWGPDGRFESDGPAPVPAAVRDYAGDAVPIVRMGPPDETRRQRLRALGYLD